MPVVRSSQSYLDPRGPTRVTFISRQARFVEYVADNYRKSISRSTYLLSFTSRQKHPPNAMQPEEAGPKSDKPCHNVRFKFIKYFTHSSSIPLSLTRTKALRCQGGAPLIIRAADLKERFATGANYSHVIILRNSGKRRPIVITGEICAHGQGGGELRVERGEGEGRRGEEWFVSRIERFVRSAGEASARSGEKLRRLFGFIGLHIFPAACIRSKFSVRFNEKGVIAS